MKLPIMQNVEGVNTRIYLTHQKRLLWPHKSNVIERAEMVRKKKQKQIPYNCCKLTTLTEDSISCYPRFLELGATFHDQYLGTIPIFIKRKTQQIPLGEMLLKIETVNLFITYGKKSNTHKYV